MLYNEGDKVEVARCKFGYSGPGEVAALAYGSNYLVKVVLPNGKQRIILVRAIDLRHSRK